MQLQSSRSAGSPGALQSIRRPGLWMMRVMKMSLTLLLQHPLKQRLPAMQLRMPCRSWRTRMMPWVKAWVARHALHLQLFTSNPICVEPESC